MVMRWNQLSDMKGFTHEHLWQLVALELRASYLSVTCILRSLEHFAVWRINIDYLLLRRIASPREHHGISDIRSGRGLSLYQ